MWTHLKHTKKNHVWFKSKWKKKPERKKYSTLFNTSKKYFTVMYSLNLNRRYFCCSDVVGFFSEIRLVHCKNWNSCGFQSPFCTESFFSLPFSLIPFQLTRIEYNANNFNNSKNVEKNLLAKYFRWFYFIWLAVALRCFVLQSTTILYYVIYSNGMEWKANKSLFECGISRIFFMVYSKRIAFLGLFRCLYCNIYINIYAHFGLQPNSFRLKLFQMD